MSSFDFIYENTITDLKLEKFNTKNVKDTSHIFENIKSLKNINLSNFDTKMWSILKICFIAINP